jgi:hypothetical protein
VRWRAGARERRVGGPAQCLDVTCPDEIRRPVPIREYLPSGSSRSLLRNDVESAGFSIQKEFLDLCESCLAGLCLDSVNSCLV